MDKLKSLMIFMRSAQCGSFSEAARQLGMAPSAVSRAVLRLAESLRCGSATRKTFQDEDELRVRLLQRTTRSLTLTEDGNRFYQRAQQILNDLEEAESIQLARLAEEEKAMFAVSNFLIMNQVP